MTEIAYFDSKKEKHFPQICFYCAHLISRMAATCSQYPKGIPDATWYELRKGAIPPNASDTCEFYTLRKFT